MTILGLLSCTLGCEDPFMPLGNDQWIMRFTSPSNIDFIAYQIVFCETDASVCGRRKVNPDLYQPDFCWSDVDGTDVDMRFTPTRFSSARIEAGWFSSADILEPEGKQGVHCNDLPAIVVNPPPSFEITAPVENTTLSRASQSSIRVEWSPGASAFPMAWKLIPLDNDLSIKPCDMLPWQAIEEQGVDEGFAEIPMDLLPSDLPPEGCDMIVTVSRLKSFDLPDGVSNGSILSTAVDGVIFRIKP